MIRQLQFTNDHFIVQFVGQLLKRSPHCHVPSVDFVDVLFNCLITLACLSVCLRMSSSISVAEKIIGRKFDITEYGICYIQDILDDIPESAIMVSCHHSLIVVSIPIYDHIDLPIHLNELIYLLVFLLNCPPNQFRFLLSICYCPSFKQIGHRC